MSTLNSTRPALTSFTAFAVSSVTVPVLGFGMRPRGPSTLPSLRTSPIACGRGNRDIEIIPAFDALLDHVVEADIFSARGLGRLSRRTLREHQHAHHFAAAVRERNSAAHHLVGLLGIDSQFERQINGFVELGFRELDENFDGRLERIRFAGIHQFERLAVTLASLFRHLCLCGARTRLPRLLTVLVPRL